MVVTWVCDNCDKKKGEFFCEECNWLVCADCFDADKKICIDCYTWMFPVRNVTQNVH